MTNTNVNATLDDIVFEHRNKDYGAYELRTTYAKTLNRAFVIGTSIVMISISASAIYSSYQHDKEIKREVVINLEDLRERHELPPVEPPKPEEPKPEPHKLEIVKFVPPVPVEETVEEYDVPTDEKMEGTQIGSIDQEGDKSTSIIEEAVPVEVPKSEAVVAEVEDPNKVFITVEQQPSFEGGLSEMYKFLGKKLNYPSQAQRANVEGKVFLSFIVEKDGSITDVSTMKGIGFGCDEEAERVIKLMPKWIAGKQNGRAVRVKFTIPVVFKLSE